ncbi:MAG TPA: hypothetical protein VK435_00665, partial [Thermodesulfovibrionales bacterium]|nr:hypothetical protein [Thermodesulfovibrionales bacterium]
REIKKLKPGMPILILSLYPEDQYPAHLLKEAGATGYLAKDAVPTGLLQAVRCILEGGTFFGSEESGTGRHI